MKLSVVLATKNEKANIKECLASVKLLADEIIVVDEYSDDLTRALARKMGAKVYKNKHKNNFHESKQLAIDKATGDWILQLDADERVSEKLAEEIKHVINLDSEKILKRRPKDNFKWKLFRRHEKLLRFRDGKLGDDSGDVVAFFLPRKNYFVGKPLTYAGVYPDAVIRLFKKDKAYLPAVSVHEQMVVKGRVAWLFNDLEHHESPSLKRYVSRLNRYTDEHQKNLARQNIERSYWQLINYSFIKPVLTFIRMYFRHRGYKDGVPGFVWCVFSSFHFPLAFYKYWNNKG